MVPTVAAARARFAPSFLERLPALRHRAVALAFWVLVPIFCLFVLANGGDKLARHVNHHPAGVRGTFTVTVHNCQQQLCIAGGTFVSSDGSMEQDLLQGLYSWQKGKQYTAYYEPSSGEIVPLPAKWDASSTVVGMAGSLGFLIVWALCLRASLRRRTGAVPVASWSASAAPV